jgi:hypothetical protein
MTDKHSSNATMSAYKSKFAFIKNGSKWPIETDKLIIIIFNLLKFIYWNFLMLEIVWNIEQIQGFTLFIFPNANEKK